MGRPNANDGSSNPSLREYFIRGAGGTMGLNGLQIGLGLLLSLILARTLGAEGLGLYIYAISWIGVLVMPGLLGLERLLVREIAALRSKRSWDLLSGMLGWSARLVTIASCAVALTAGGVAYVASGFEITRQLRVFWICLPVLPLEALLHLRYAMLRGLQRVVLGALPLLLVRPLAFLVLVGGAAWIFGGRFSASSTAMLQVVAASAAVLLSWKLLRRTLPPETAAAEPRYEPGRWIRSALPFLAIGGLSALLHRLDLLMLGAIRGAESAGIYAIAQRGAGLLTLVLVAANAPLAPLLSRIHVEGDFARMQRVVTKTARALLLATLPLAAALILFRKPLLGVFGAEFVVGDRALVILCAGQLVNVAMGSVGLILNMTGHEREVLFASGAGVVLNLVLNAILIPRYGIEGAAIASAASLSFWNVLLAFRVTWRMGIHTTALGPLGRGRRREE